MSDFLSHLSSGYLSIDVSFYVMLLFCVICVFTMAKMLKPMSNGNTESLNLLVVIEFVSGIAAFISMVIHVAASVICDSAMSDSQALIMMPVAIASVVIFACMIRQSFKEARKEETANV